MTSRNRIIIDTDPGVDDMLALLLAFAAQPEELEVLLVSVTYGNTEVQNCLRNVVALFHVLNKELEWRRAQGQLEGFNTMKAFKPLVAVGPEHALDDEILMADHFHGKDGLAGVHDSHSHLSPSDTWKSLFQTLPSASAIPQTAEAPELTPSTSSFLASQNPAHQEILRILRENPADTITIVAIGPLTNLAIAAAEDTRTFLRVKEVVVMGGAINVKGNITPVAEFNTFADAIATARVFALTSPDPASTMPPVISKTSSLPSYPANLPRQLKLTLMPLDITNSHCLTRSMFEARVAPLIKAGSPLAEWTGAFLKKTFEKINYLEGKTSDPGLALHDPLCIWYMLTRSAPSWMSSPKGLEDIRVETGGQWTRGMHVIDRRNRPRVGQNPTTARVGSPGAAGISSLLNAPIPEGEAGEGSQLPVDHQGWLGWNKGNRINRIVSSPGNDALGRYLLEHIFA